MALRGKPRLPFYMVGRMEGQSMVLRAEKGKLRLSVDDEEDDKTQEVIYNLNEEGHDHGKDDNEEQRKEAGDGTLRSDGQMPGGPVDMDGAAQTLGDMPGAVGAVGGAAVLAEAGDGGNAPGAGAESTLGEGAGALPASSGNAGEAEAHAPDEYAAGQARKDAVEGPGRKESGDLKGREARRPAQE